MDVNRNFQKFLQAVIQSIRSIPPAGKRRGRCRPENGTAGRVKEERMLSIHQISERLWYTEPAAVGSRPALGAFLAGDTLIRIDGGNSPMHREDLLDVLPEEVRKKPRKLVLTHGHWDHSFGAEPGREEILVSPETAAWMSIPYYPSEYGKKNVAAEYGAPFGEADIPGFPAWDRLVCDRPGVKNAFVKKENGLIMEHGTAVPMDPPIREEIAPGLEAVRVSCDHHEGSLLLYCPEEKVLFLGDALYNGNLDWNGRKYYSSERYIRFIDFLDTVDAELVVMGHGRAMSRLHFREHCLRWRNAAELSRGITEEETMLEYYRETRGGEPEEWLMKELHWFLVGNRRERCVCQKNPDR